MDAVHETPPGDVTVGSVHGGQVSFGNNNVLVGFAARPDRDSSPVRNPGRGRRVFVGHGQTGTGRLVQRAAVEFLQVAGFTVDYFGGRPRTGRVALDVVVEMVGRADAAVLLHTCDDEMVDGGFRARQNVVYETGLCHGLLGAERTIILREDGCEPFSNLDGVQELRFRAEDLEHALTQVLVALTAG